MVAVALLAPWVGPTRVGLSAEVPSSTAVRLRVPLDDRHVHEAPPDVPKPQRPEPSTPANVDTYRPFLEWQHVTGSWTGTRPFLDDRGIVVESTLVVDGSRNFRGGVDTERTIVRYLFDLNLTLDTERVGGWSGGTFFLDFQSHDGETGDLIVGDLQVFSNIDAIPRTQLPQIWYEHRFLEDEWRIKVGKLDANSEFAYTVHGAEFLNSSMGFSPTIFLMPTYPDPASSLSLYWAPGETFFAGVGLFDGAGARGVPLGSRGPQTLFDGSNEFFTIGEAGVNWTAGAGRVGRLAAGGWHHNGRFDGYDGRPHSGTGGFYAVLDQQLYRLLPEDEDDLRGLGLFLQYGWADERVSPFEQHLGGGLAWTGPLRCRPHDLVGLGATWAGLSRLPGAGFSASSETAVETFYQVALTRFSSLTCDVQYVANPGGLAERRDALVGTLRWIVRF